MSRRTYTESLQRGECRWDLNISFDPDGGGLVVETGDGRTLRALVLPYPDGGFGLQIGDRSISATATVAAETVEVSLAGAQQHFRRIFQDEETADGSGRPDHVLSPMPGKLVEIRVAVGDRVDAGQTVAIVEAMKLQQQLQAQTQGVVATIEAAVGDQLLLDQAILTLDLDDG